MWDCRHRTLDDQCRRRKAVCYPGGIGCTLKKKFAFPFRQDEDPLAVRLAAKKSKPTLKKVK